MKYKSYPEYKDPGIEWIGKMPANWLFIPIVGICEIGRGRVISNQEIEDNVGEYPVYSSQTSNNGEMGRINSYDFNGEYVTWTTDGANAGTAFYRDGKFNCTNVCGTLKAKSRKINMKLLPYTLNCILKNYVRYDINPKLMNNMIARIRIPLANRNEQNIIANFLDKKIAEIDKLIKRDKKLIELLQERRIALINHVVTKGLNSNARMKDSGIEWIGKIPEGWEIDKMKNVADVSISNIDKKSKPSETDILLCNYIDVYRNDFINNPIEFMKATASHEQIKKLSLFKNDILITKDSETPDDIAVPALVLEDLKNVVCGYHLALLRPNQNRILGRYLFRALQSKILNQQFTINANGITRFGISTYPIKNSMIVIPSIEEQQKIANYLDEKTSKIDSTIQKIQQKINLLEEYKKSLIHHVVTGKVDVRSVKV